MKNIHVLPTSQPSRLYIHSKLGLILNTVKHKDTGYNQNIYITNSEEIKEGQNYIGDGFSGKNKFKWHKSQVELYPNIKKDIIILTTDQDLIKDGVQAIDDEFLEWFVKNPSCEEVEVEIWTDYRLENNKEVPFKNYKMIILKEEHKQETLEEAAERATRNESLGWENEYAKEKFIEGAKWQQERMYSEEEVENIIEKLMNDVHCGNICEGDDVIDFKVSARQWFNKIRK